MPKLKVDLSDTIYRKLLKQKANDGFKHKTFKAWLTFLVKNVRLNPMISDLVQDATKEGLLRMWMQNFADNLADIRKGKTIKALVPEKLEEIPKGAAIVVGAGPSLWTNKHLELLAESNFDGLIILTDRMLIPCLERKIIPDYVINVDGSREHIVKFFDHPLFDKYGPQIKVCLITNVAHNVVQRCRKAKAQIYWYTALFDDIRSSESVTRVQQLMTSNTQLPNGVAAVQCGGNSGTAAWVFAHSLLRRSPIALIGLDLSYPEGTKLEDTPYYSGFLKTTPDVGKVAIDYYPEYYNPYFKTKARADVVFYHYRKSFLELVHLVPPWVETWNATEGGILFGPRIKCIKFMHFLKYYRAPIQLKKHQLHRD